MNYPIRLTRTGFLEGLIPFGAALTPQADLALDWWPPGQRPVLLDNPESFAGKETSLKIDEEDGLWVAAQLAKAAKYREYIEAMVKAGRLSFGIGTMAKLATKSLSGSFTRLPIVNWELQPLVQAGKGYVLTPAT